MSNPATGGDENILNNPTIVLSNAIAKLSERMTMAIGAAAFAVIVFIGNAGFTYSQISEVKDTFADLKGSVGELHGIVGSLHESVDKLQSTTNQLDGLITNLDKTVGKLEVTVNHLQESVSKLSDRADRIEKQATSIEVSAKVIKGIKDDLQAIRKAIEHQDKTNPKDKFDILLDKIKDHPQSKKPQ